MESILVRARLATSCNISALLLPFSFAMAQTIGSIPAIGKAKARFSVTY